MKKRLLCLFLTLALLVTVLLPAVPAAQASTKTEKTRAIAIVFDNSGSMYTGSNTSGWCRATYATEAFASMMNEGDQLQIYPMTEITLDDTNQSYSMDSPLVIHGPEEASTIRKIFTDKPWDTPFRTVEKAYAGLKQTKADEKYLIILTDGKFEEGNKVEDMDHVNNTLEQYRNDVQVMYLGLNVKDEYTPKESSCHYYKNTSSSAAVLNELTAICNQIFGRDVLDFSGNNVTFDVSMSKLIVFVQGKDISNVTLGGQKPISQHALRYRDKGSNYYADREDKDETLQGVIATFEDFKGDENYELKYTGTATSATIYYEPDVDLKIDLVSEGEVPVGKELYPGTYKLSYALWDGQLDKATESALLKNVNYTVTLNGEQQNLTDPSKPGSLDVEVAAGDKLTGAFSVTYLKDYSIKKSSENLDWWPKGGFNVVPRPVGQVTAKVEGGQDVYPLSQLEELAVYEVSLFCEGEQITGDDLDRADLKVDIDGGNTLPDIQKTENGFTVSLKYNGSAADTTCGIQNATFSASYSNKDGNSGNADPIVREFDIQDDSSTLAVEIQLEQNYYVISKLDGAAPIRFYLTSEGAPLGAEQFAATDFQVDMDGLAYDLQPDSASSSYVATLQPGQKIDARKYTITCTANGLDEIGRPISAEDSAKIECRPYPAWLPWVIAAAILVALLSIIWAILNTKILPKKIMVSAGAVFNVDGELIPGNVVCSYSGGNKKRGSLRIQSPPYMANPLAKCGLILDLEAVSPRRTKSRSRGARVRGVKPLNPATAVSISIAAFQMAKDPVTERLTRVGANPDAPIDFRIGNNNQFVTVAEIMSADDGNTVSCSLTGNFKFL